MYKTILVPTSGSDTDAAVFATALALAKPFAAHLRFFHLHLSLGEAAARVPHVEFARGPAIADALEHLRKQGDRRSADASRHCQEFCRSNSIPMDEAPGCGAVSASWLVETRDAASTLLFHARHSDAVVLGRAHGRELIPGLIGRLLTESGRPVIIAPDAPLRGLSGTVVVGWKETPEAARALATALPLLERAQRVVLLSVTEDAATSSEAVEDLARQLAWHGVSAEIHVIGEESGTARTQLERIAVQLDADLLVVGGYGHGQFREQVFGGVTQSLIDGALLPIMMVH